MSKTIKKTVSRSKKQKVVKEKPVQINEEVSCEKHPGCVSDPKPEPEAQQSEKAKYEYDPRLSEEANKILETLFDEPTSKEKIDNLIQEFAKSYGQEPEIKTEKKVVTPNIDEIIRKYEVSNKVFETLAEKNSQPQVAESKSAKLATKPKALHDLVRHNRRKNLFRYCTLEAQIECNPELWNACRYYVEKMFKLPNDTFVEVCTKELFESVVFNKKMAADNDLDPISETEIILLWNNKHFLVEKGLKSKIKNFISKAKGKLWHLKNKFKRKINA